MCAETEGKLPVPAGWRFADGGLNAASIAIADRCVSLTRAEEQETSATTSNEGHSQVGLAEHFESITVLHIHPPVAGLVECCLSSVDADEFQVNLGLGAVDIRASPEDSPKPNQANI
eukprot:6517927-Alexandrium_andersonii.AAC.1